MKTLSIILLSFLPVFSFCQAFVACEATNKGVGINAGYINHYVLKIGLNAPINSNAGVPNIFYSSAGYQLRVRTVSLTPSLGIAKYHVQGKEDEEINKYALLTSVELSNDFTVKSGNKGRCYLFYTHAIQNFFGAGLKIFIQ